MIDTLFLFWQFICSYLGIPTLLAGYLSLGLVLFLETAILFFAWLPGDSLLIAAGLGAAFGELNVHGLMLALSICAWLGTTCNYGLGYFIASRGPVHRYPRVNRWLSQEKFKKTLHYMQRYGTIVTIIAPFLPFARTVAPLLAGFSQMPLSRFLINNTIGIGLWMICFLYGSYYFGNWLPDVTNSAHALTVLVLSGLVSLLLALAWQQRRGKVLEK
jgi:membrane-associated protein